MNPTYGELAGSTTDPYIRDLYAAFQYLLDNIDDQTEKEMIYALLRLMRIYQPEKSHQHPECEEWITEALLLFGQCLQQNRVRPNINDSSNLSICQLRTIQDTLISLL